jgi:hypothetical protein
MIIFMLILLVIVFVLIKMNYDQHKYIKELENAPLDTRARNERGHYIADDPATPVNEAYKPRKIVAPAKKPAKKTKK